MTLYRVMAVHRLKPEMQGTRFLTTKVRRPGRVGSAPSSGRASQKESAATEPGVQVVKAWQVNAVLSPTWSEVAKDRI